jgi:hypothetical protein
MICKNKKNIILIFFKIKNILKNNHNQQAKTENELIPLHFTCRSPLMIYNGKSFIQNQT